MHTGEICPTFGTGLKEGRETPFPAASLLTGVRFVVEAATLLCSAQLRSSLSVDEARDSLEEENLRDFGMK